MNNRHFSSRPMDDTLLARLGIAEAKAWCHQWQQRLRRIGEPPLPIDPRLLWGFALPLLSAMQQEGPPDSGRGQRLVFGLQAPVGAGKSTLGRQLQRLAATAGLQVAVASIDDAYLPWAERRRRLQGNPFGVNRVPPGSHDPGLLLEAIERWRQGEPLVLPRFDKTLMQGEGDRSGWTTLNGADALLLEGWLVGYEPVGPAAVASWLDAAGHDLNADEQAWLPTWDRQLKGYSQLWQACNSLWVLVPDRWSSVLRWRVQAEARQRRAGGSSLDGPAIKALVRSSLASLPPGLYNPGVINRATAVARLDGRRRCLQVTPPLV